MKTLKELTQIVTKKKAIKIELIDGKTFSGAKNKFNQFYDGLVEGKFEDDNDAALHIYGTSSTDARYRQLKSRFRRRLLNSLFFLDVNQAAAPNYDKALLTCEREWALVNILRYNGAIETVCIMARSILKTAKKYHFTHIIVPCARLLRERAAQTGDAKAFQTYNKYLQEFTKKQEAEIKSEELYQLVTINYYKSAKNQTLSFVEDINSYCDQLLSLSELYNAPVINLNMFLVWIIRYELQRDYEAMLEVCRQAEQYLETHPQYYNAEKAALIEIKKMSVFLHTKEYKGGKANIDESLKTVSKGSPDWFTFLEYYLLLAVHTGHYISALAIFNQAIAHINFSSLEGLEAEKWLVFEAYLHYFIEIKELQNAVAYNRRKNTFKVDTFLNTQYAYPRDQVNLTVSLVSLQILFLLEKKNLRKVTEKINHLRKFALPHLQRSQNERPLHFVRLLQQLIRTDFQVDGLVDQNRNLQKLKASPLRYKGKVADLEVIPYDKMWERIVHYLQ